MNHYANPGAADDPRGRLDIGLVRVGELVVKRHIEPRLNGVRLWDHGFGEVVEELVAESGVPSHPVSLVEVLRMAGLLPERRRPVT